MPAASPLFVSEQLPPNKFEADPHPMNHVELPENTFGQLSQADAYRPWSIQFGDWGVIRQGQGAEPQVLSMSQHSTPRLDNELDDINQDHTQRDETNEVIQLQSEQCIYCPTEYSDQSEYINDDAAAGAYELHRPNREDSLISWLDDAQVTKEAYPGELDESTNAEQRTPRPGMANGLRRSRSF
jgi:hypothetical protein